MVITNILPSLARMRCVDRFEGQRHGVTQADGQISQAMMNGRRLMEMQCESNQRGTADR